MTKETGKKTIAKKTVRLLDSVLKQDMSSMSCCVFYQPKLPEGMERFKKK